MVCYNFNSMILFWEQTVFQRILKQIRKKVRQHQYVMTLHA